MKSPADSLFDAVNSAGSTAPAPRRASLGAAAAILAALALVLIPLSTGWIPHEVSRWHQAVAQEKRLDGDLPGAIAALDAALQSAPERVDLRLLRSRYRADRGDLEGSLEDAIAARERDAQDVAALRAHSVALQKLGRFEDALENHLQLAALAGVRDLAALENAVDPKTHKVMATAASLPYDKEERAEVSQALNELAYARALARKDLDAALKDIALAIHLTSARAEYLDTRGYLRLLTGDLTGALDDMNKAVAAAERLRDQIRQQRRSTLVDRREFQRALEAEDLMVAVLLYHRGLVHDALGNANEAAADYARVRKLGHEPGEALF